MVTNGYRLAIDFSASRTVAVLALPDGRTLPLLSDAAAPLDAVEGVLAKVAAEAYRVGGGAPASMVLVHPAGWSQDRAEFLAAAARRANLGEPALVSAPVAAAAYVAGVLRREVQPGMCVVVCDVGAGGFEVSVVRRSPAGFEVVTTAGHPDQDAEAAAALALDTLRSSGIPREAVACLIVVGDPGLIPLAVGSLHRTLQILPAVVDRPDLVVVEGALHASGGVAPPQPPQPAQPAWRPGPAMPPALPSAGVSRTPWVIAGGLAVVAVAVAAVFIGVNLSGDGLEDGLGGSGTMGTPTAESTGPTAAESTGPTAAESIGPAAATTGAAEGQQATCAWTPVSPASNPNVVDVGTPPARVPTAGTGLMSISTNQGLIEVSVDRAKAPCAAASLAYLASKRFYDNTPCHRLVTAVPEVLQCGDPTGTGLGGPAYQFGEENLPSGPVLYPAGVLAMAKAADPGTTGSQFFIVYKDIPRSDPAAGTLGINPDYTVVGTVTKGLDVVQRIAAAGVAGGGADGTPKLETKILHLEVS